MSRKRIQYESLAFRDSTEYKELEPHELDGALCEAKYNTKNYDDMSMMLT